MANNLQGDLSAGRFAPFEWHRCAAGGEAKEHRCTPQYWRSELVNKGIDLEHERAGSVHLDDYSPLPPRDEVKYGPSGTGLIDSGVKDSGVARADGKAVAACKKDVRLV